MRTHITTLVAITCTTFLACSQQPSPSNVAVAKDSYPPVATDVNDSATASISAKSFLDTFLVTQKCILAKQLEALSNSTSTQKPSAEDIAKMTKTLEDKAQDSNNKDAAWNELSKGCNDSEISSMNRFFTCQKAACDDTNPTSANEKHKACALPDAGEGCKKSFGEFIHHFSPM